MQTERKEFFWKIAVVVLFLFVLVQSSILYFVLFKPVAKQGMIQEQADAVIVPRSYTVQQNTMPMNSGNYLRPSQQMRIGNASNRVAKNNTSGNTCANILPPLPQVSTQQPQATCTSPVISSNLSTSTCPGGISNTTIATSRNANINGMMQAMMNDPFFDNDSFFGNVDDEFARMSQLMDAMFSGGMGSSFANSGFGRGGSRASYHLKDDGNNYIFEMKIPGLDKSDVKAEVNRDILTISGTQKQEVQNNTQYGNSYSSSYSSFQNSFRLPGKVDNKNIKVSYDNKTLKVILPKV